jgi:hypothetical protein
MPKLKNIQICKRLNLKIQIKKVHIWIARILKFKF